MIYLRRRWIIFSNNFDRRICPYCVRLIIRGCLALSRMHAIHLLIVLKRNLLGIKNLPKIRADNDPQFISHEFENYCNNLDLGHERIPVKKPDMNTHIESFHSVLEDECYNRNKFYNFKEDYIIMRILHNSVFLEVSAVNTSLKIH